MKHPLLLPLLPFTFALAFLTAAPARAQFTLITTGGTFLSGNLSTAGATSFAFDVLSGGSYSEHQIAHLNDGMYGNSFSWIGQAASTYAGILLAAPTTLGSFAFGRDNLPFETDRADGTYMVQYSRDPISGFSAGIATWFTVGTLNYSSSPPASPALRHLYELTTPIAGVTAFRLVTQGGGDGGQAIDEIELYAAPIPEPSTTATVIGLLALCLVARRRLK